MYIIKKNINVSEIAKTKCTQIASNKISLVKIKGI